MAKPQATTDQATERCILRSHRDYAGSNCAVCGREVPPLPWTSDQLAIHGTPLMTGAELIARKGTMPQAPDPADAAIPETEEEREAQAREAEAHAAYDEALRDLNRLKWTLGDYVVMTSSGYQAAGDQRATEAQRHEAKAMLPQAQELADAASDRFLAARIEVRRLAEIRAAKLRQWHFDQQEALARAAAAKAATTRATPFRSFLQRLAKNP